MNIRILGVPYDSGRRSARMGAGPEAFLRCGFERGLRERGHDVRVEMVEARGDFHAEVGSAFSLCADLALRVRDAVAGGDFPLVLAGNCGTSVGVLAGLRGAGAEAPGRQGVGPEPPGLVWLDAHGDFHTPETTTSGFLDGMGLAIAAGRCWRRVAASIPGFEPVPAPRIVHAGGRDFDPGEREALETFGARVVTAADIRERGIDAALGPALDDLAGIGNGGDGGVHLHIDVDVLDPSAAPSNSYAPEGGLRLEEAASAVEAVHARLPVRAVALASYDPALDPSCRTPRVVAGLLETLLPVAGGR